MTRIPARTKKRGMVQKHVATYKTIKNIVNYPSLGKFSTKHGCLTEIHNLIQAQTVGIMSTVTAQNCVA